MKLKGIWVEKPYYNQFLILVAIVLVCTGIGLTLWTLSLSPCFGINASDLQHIDWKNSSMILAQEWLLIVQNIFVFILPAWIMAFFVSDAPTEYLHINRKVNIKLFLLAAITMLAALPLIDEMSFINNKMALPEGLKVIENWMKQAEAQAAQLTEIILTIHSPLDFLFKLILIGAIPAIGEELIFRGVIQRLFEKWLRNKHAAVILTAILFSAMHMQFYGFLPRFTMGVYLGYLLVFTGSIWVPILAHFVNNGTAVIMAYYDPSSIKEESTVTPNILLVLASILIVALLIDFTKRQKSYEKKV